MSWPHFVAYAVFIAATFIWIQSRRASGRALTVAGVVGLFIVFWLVLELAGAIAAIPNDPRVQRRSYVFAESGKRIPYALFVPSNYDRGKKWPLIVGLHGVGRSYDHLMGYDGFIDLAQREGYILVTPLGYNAFGWFGSAGPGLVPGQSPERVRQALDDVECPLRYTGAACNPDVSVINAFEAGEVRDLPPPNLGALSEKDVMNVLALVRQELSIDPDRIYLWGHSMGGGGAYHLAEVRPDLWAAIAVAAPAPDAHLEQLQHFKQIPVLVLQGDADPTVVKTRLTVDAMKQLGMRHQYTEVKGGDHELFVSKSPNTLSGVFSFFGSIRRN